MEWPKFTISGIQTKLRELVDRVLPQPSREPEGEDVPLSIQRIKIYPIRCSNCGTPLEDGDMVVIWRSGAITHYTGDPIEPPKEPPDAN